MAKGILILLYHLSEFEAHLSEQEGGNVLQLHVPKDKSSFGR